MAFPKPDIDDYDLLTLFNNRDVYAFEKIYLLYNRELEFFAAKLYANTEVMALDVVHDSFFTLWGNKNIVFEDSHKIKPYLYAIIRNGYRNYIVKQKVKSKYVDKIINDNDFYSIMVAENEIQAILEQSLDILPDDCFHVLEMLLNGWNVNEIATSCHCSERTVYNKKDKAIEIVKTRLGKDQLILLAILLS